ncbi:PREDICTED: uncharacterized protein LOC107069746 [Polistes dominula]|uniref:Uncharacterized protein LOC107069746 n=1 Tax=Polistes dominula TaxID=743375 RepID=A0ABM1IRF0_POLDO|nr:PREDICTED: uncharacterized protein LOC107069746 [Polistes dominula]
MSTTLIKMITCRINSRPLARFMKEIQQDYSDENYRNTKERSIFNSYNKLSYRFITITVPSMTLVLVTYFTREALTSVLSVMSNSTLEYQLPYKIRPLIKPKDSMSFFLGCIYQSLSIPLIISAYVGVDCLFASLAIHITAQFAILKHRIEESLKDRERGIRKVIIEHCRLIRLAETLEDNFTAIIFQQLLATTFQLCLTGYQMLVILKTSMGYLSVLRKFL